MGGGRESRFHHFPSNLTLNTPTGLQKKGEGDTNLIVEEEIEEEGIRAVGRVGQ